MAESTFGRRAVNDGKLVHRLREGKRITIDTPGPDPGLYRGVDARRDTAAAWASSAAGEARSKE